MTFTSLDAITRSKLLQLNLPIHYYVQYLKYGADCMRELTFDTLRVVNAKLLPVTSYGAVVLPNDIVEVLKVGLPVGQKVRPLHQDHSFNRLYNLTSNGGKIKFPDAKGYSPLEQPTDYQNDYGELIGRVFGFSDKFLQDTYKFLPERNEIQLNNSISENQIVVEYISDGSQADAATKVDPLAQACIETYMDWKSSPNAKVLRSPEGQTFSLAWKKLKARKNPLTPADIKRIYNSSKTATK